MRGRVVAAGEARGAPALREVDQDAPTRQHRIISAEVVAAHEEAQRLLMQAQRAAAQIVEEARAEAEQVHAQREREAAARAEAELAARYLRLRQEQQGWLQEQQGLVIEIARALSERLLGRALALDPSMVVDLAREALRSVARARRVALFVHPDDEQPLRAQLGELGLSASVLEVHVDSSRPRGSLLADTDVGSIDARIAPQLDRLVAALADGR